MKEVWRDAPGYEGLYQVSNLGRIKSLQNGKAKILRLLKNSKGYLRVCLSNENRKYIRVHRLIAFAFIPNPENKPQINHKNGIKTDNRIENLEWITCSDNHKHAFKIGLKTNNHLKKPVIQYDLQDNKIAEYSSLANAYRATGAHPTNISDVCNGIRNKAAEYKWRFK